VWFFLVVGNEEGVGGDSSKSNSITSERSVQSAGVPSSQSSSTNSIPPMHDPTDDGLNHHYPSPLSIRPPRARSSIASSTFSMDRVPNNFATIRTTSIVTKQQKEHMQEDMYEQMSGYKRMRREHQGALVKVQQLFWNTNGYE
jgi:thousand and one amino acid protein kinase